MRRERVQIAAVTVAAMLSLMVSGTFAAAQSDSALDVHADDGSYPALADLVQAALDGRISSRDVPDQAAQTPFGGPSTATNAVQQDAGLESTFAFTINPSGRRSVTGDALWDFAGVSVRVDVRQGASAPINPIALDEIRADGIVAPVGPDGPMDMSALVRDLGLDPDEPWVQQWGDRNAIVVGPPTSLRDMAFRSPVLVWGGRTNTPLPLDRCGLNIREFVVGADGELIWQGELAPADIFNGTATDVALTCDEAWELNRFVNVGEVFDNVATTSFAIVTPEAFVAFTELAEFDMATGFRITGFATDAANPYQPDTTAFVSDPLFPGLASPPPHIVLDVFADLNGPFAVNQTFIADPPFAAGSPCGVSEWQGVFDIYLGDLGPDDTGNAALVQFASGQLTTGRWSFGDGGHIQITTSGIGEGYIEHLDLNGAQGEYIYMSGDTECPYAVTVDTGWDDLAAAVALATEPDPIAPDVQEEATLEIGDASDPSSTSAPTGDGSDGWVWWLIGLGLAATAGGVALAKSGAQQSKAERSDDTFLRSFNAEDAEWELNEVDLARWKYLQDADATTAWTTAQAAETALQAEIETLVASAMGTTNKAITGYSEGVETYSTAMGTLLKDSEDIGQIYNEWNRKGGVKDIMWWADLADAVVGVTTLALKLGTGATKMVVRLVKSTDDAADAGRVAVSVAKSGDEASAVVSTGPKLSEADQIYDGAGFVQLDSWLCRVLGRGHIDDYAEALPAAALKLGYRMDLTSLERVVLNQLIVKARLASRGAAVEFDPNALAWLHRMAQQPDFWKNLKIEVALDIDTRVYRIVDEVEMAWLKTLAGSPEAAKAASVPAPAPLADTVAGGGAITLPHQHVPAAVPRTPFGDTVVGGGAITLPHPIPVPRSVPMSVPRAADAAANPTGLGGLTPLTSVADQVPGTAEAVLEGVRAGTATSQGYQVGVALGWFGMP